MDFNARVRLRRDGAAGDDRIGVLGALVRYIETEAPVEGLADYVLIAEDGRVINADEIALLSESRDYQRWLETDRYGRSSSPY